MTRPISAESAQVSLLIVLLHLRTGLSFEQIAGRLSKDFDVTMTREAVWQRYKRWENRR